MDLHGGQAVKQFDPEFEVTRTDSMQWNRTQNLEILGEIDGDPSRPVELPQEVLDKVRALITEEAARLAQAEGISAPPDQVVQVNIKSKSR